MGPLLLLAQRAHAEDEPCGVERPWVLMHMTELEAPFAAQLIGDLRAGLGPSRIDACTPDSVERKAAIATVKIAPVPDQPSSYSIDVSDSLTQKRIGRDVDLAHVPVDGRAFALAVAAEELLRASWAELAIAREKPPPEESPPPAPPPAPKPRPRAAPPEPAPAPVYSALGLGLGFESYTGGQVHFGIDAYWLEPVFPGTWLGVVLGARRSLSVEAPSGSISARSLQLEVSVQPTLKSSALYRLEGLLALSASRIWFLAEPIAGATGKEESSSTVFGRAGLALVLGRQGSLRSLSGVGLGAPLRSFSASDGGSVVTGVSGLEVFARSGVAFEF